MGRLLSLMILLPALARPCPDAEAEPVFFSMLFPQLLPWTQETAHTPGEAVFL